MLSKSVFANCASLMAAIIVFSAPVRADQSKDALLQAEKLEAGGNYAAAASAYLAVLEGFNFVPKSSSKTEYSKEEKIVIGKCAINCLEQGIKQKLKAGAEIKDCPEFQLLAGASITMMNLEPSNQKWTYLRAFTLMKQSQYKKADELFNRCLLGSDQQFKLKALAAKSEIKPFLARE